MTDRVTAEAEAGAGADRAVHASAARTSSSPTTNAAAPAAPTLSAAQRLPDLVIARVHLRLGSLGIARAELETLAGRDLLDDEGVRDLAEARWRTGDGPGAGEAAAAYLESRPDDVLALVIAAEAQADLGRPGEARRLAGKALDVATGSLDPIFAGMPRSAIWPADPGVAATSAGVLFDDLHPGPLPTAGDGATILPWATDDQAMDELLDSRLPPVVVGGPSLWGDEDVSMAAAVLDPTTLFHSGRLALEQGRQEDAATALILALRAAPALAPAVLDLLGGRAEPILALVRGDAQRIVGREVEALRDHAAAASQLTREEPAPDPTQPDPDDGDPGSTSEAT